MVRVRVFPWTYCRMGAPSPGMAASAIWLAFATVYCVGLNRTLKPLWPFGVMEIFCSSTARLPCAGVRWTGGEPTDHRHGWRVALCPEPAASVVHRVAWRPAVE